MILFALTMLNDVSLTSGASQWPLSRIAAHNWNITAEQSISGTDTGWRITARNPTYSIYMEPTNAVSPKRYLVTCLRVRRQAVVPATDSLVSTVSFFGLEFKNNLDYFGQSISGRDLALCIVHDTSNDTGYGYINGRNIGAIVPTRRIRIDANSRGGTMQLLTSHLSVYSLDEPSLMGIPPLVALELGSDQTGWDVPNTLDADLGKNDPSLLEPVVSTRADGSQIRVAANGITLVEAAGSTSDGTLVNVSGNALTLGETQKAAKPVLVNATGSVTVTRTSE